MITDVLLSMIASFQAGFTSKGYQCTCLEGYDGERCEKAGACFFSFLLIYGFFNGAKANNSQFRYLLLEGIFQKCCQWFAAAQT